MKNPEFCINFDEDDNDAVENDDILGQDNEFTEKNGTYACDNPL